MAEREELDALRAAWRALTPPEPSEREPDAAERAAVEWMRAAWATLEPPPAAVPLRLRARRWRPVLALSGSLAAAASVLALAWIAPQGSERATEELAQRAPEDEPAAEPPARKPLAALARAEGGLELRHGSVRLILIPPDEADVDEPR